jgi:hypothetical protein
MVREHMQTDSELAQLRARVKTEMPRYESLTDSQKKALLATTEYAALPQPVDYSMTYGETFHALWVGCDKKFREELPETEFREFRYKQGEWVSTKEYWKVTSAIWLALYLLGFAAFAALNPNLPRGGWTLDNPRAIQLFFILMGMPGLFPGWAIASVIVTSVVESYKKSHPSTGLLAFRQALRLHKLYAAAKEEVDAAARVAAHEANLRKHSYWELLDGYAFERATAEVLKKHQFNSTVTPGSADGGVDIQVTRNGLKGVVQCKAHVACVGPHVVRDLYGVIHHCGAQFGIIVSRGGFTRGAIAFARDKPILFLDTDDLIAMQEGKDVLANAFCRDSANQLSEMQR